MKLVKYIPIYALGLLALLALALPAQAQNLTNGLPDATLPLTGNEKVPADTYLSQGRQPQTVAISVNQLKALRVASVTNATPSTTSIDGTEADLYKIALSDNILLDAPDDLIDGQTFKIQFTQGSTGGYTVTFDADYNWFGSSAPTITSTGGRISTVTCYNDGGSLRCGSELNLTP